MTKTVTVRLTREELWELKCNFEASFDSDAGLPDKLASRVLEKLQTAYRKFYQ